LELRDLVQVKIVGDDTGSQHFGENHQPFINFLHLAQLTQVRLVNLELDLGVALHSLEHIQAAPSAVSLHLVGAVGDVLQLLQYEARHDQFGIDHPRITNIGNSAINNYARIQDQRSTAFYLF